MIRCHLSTLMGRHKMRIADVAQAMGLNRSNIAALYRENATRVDLDTVAKLCTLFQCAVGDLFEQVDAKRHGGPAGNAVAGRR